jgi:hypothetical protein
VCVCVVAGHAHARGGGAVRDGEVVRGRARNTRQGRNAPNMVIAPFALFSLVRFDTYHLIFVSRDPYNSWPAESLFADCTFHRKLLFFISQYS